MRPWAIHEFPLFELTVCDPEIRRQFRYADHTPTLDAWNHFGLIMGHWQIRGYGEFAIIEKVTKNVIGLGGFSAPEGIANIEATWCLIPSARGKGFATEAVQQFTMTFRLALLGQRLAATIACDNIASQRVAARCGFVNRGRCAIHGPNYERWEFLS